MERRKVERREQFSCTVASPQKNPEYSVGKAVARLMMSYYDVLYRIWNILEPHAGR
jgi:hypothetical protein